MESDGEGCVEDKWCMETRFTSFDKVNYMKIYIHYGCPDKPVKKGGGLKATQVAEQQCKQQENHPKTLFPVKQKKHTRKRA